jgi:hypothetical protein
MAPLFLERDGDRPVKITLAKNDRVTILANGTEVSVECMDEANLIGMVRKPDFGESDESSGDLKGDIPIRTSTDTMPIGQYQLRAELPVIPNTK